ADAGGAGSDVRCGEPQAGKAQGVVRPVLTVGVGVGQAFALVELGADQNVDDQAVRHVQSADSGSRQVRVATDAADDTDRQAAPHDLRVSGYQHAHVVQGRKRAGQG